MAEGNMVTEQGIPDGEKEGEIMSKENMIRVLNEDIFGVAQSQRGLNSSKREEIDQLIHSFYNNLEYGLGETTNGEKIRSLIDEYLKPEFDGLKRKLNDLEELSPGKNEEEEDENSRFVEESKGVWSEVLRLVTNTEAYDMVTSIRRMSGIDLENDFSLDWLRPKVNGLVSELDDLIREADKKSEENYDICYTGKIRLNGLRQELEYLKNNS